MHPDPTQNLLAKLLELPPERIREVEDFIDFLRSRAKRAASAHKKRSEFPILRVGEWPTQVQTRREDLYGDDGR